MKARIYQPPKSAMQSGKANTRHWWLEFNPADARFIDPLMGWTGSRSTLNQIRLKFSSVEEAVAYAERHGIAYDIEKPSEKPRPARRAYADNFGYSRIRT